ncbi:MAG: diaminopimelate epimerase [Thermodesulfovibrionales bacterium]|jgi:diaminopimelate epimerase
MIINFTKMHGLGNDFILIDCLQHSFGLDRSVTMGDSLRRAFGESAKKLCDRRLGVGADQILILERSETADFKMLIFNADGSEVEMCGNGIRCLAKYIWDRKLSGKNVLAIETLAGIIKPEKAGEMVKVDMGEPIFEPEKIPVHLLHPLALIPHPSGGIVDYPLRIADKEFRITCVSMGNPHAVIVVDDVANFPVTYYGPMIEAHAIFPGKSNVEFIEIISGKEIKMRVWERGSGETMACGTGACAAAVASNIKGLTVGNVTIHLPGGDLLIERASDNHVYMTGPAVEVFEGIIRQ